MKTSVQVPNRLDKLTPAQRVFISSYLDPESDTYLNGYQSYKKAHPTCSNYTAYTESWHTLRNPKIKPFVDAVGASKEDIRRNLVYANVLASKNGDVGQIVNSNMALAKLQGLLVDKTEITERTKAMTQEEIEAELAARGYVRNGHAQASTAKPVDKSSKRSHNIDSVKYEPNGVQVDVLRPKKTRRKVSKGKGVRS